MKTTVKVQLVKVGESVTFGHDGKTCSGTHYCNEIVIREEEGEVVGEYSVNVIYDGRTYKGSASALGKDIAAGLNGLYSSNFTRHEAAIVGGSLPAKYPLVHKNQSGGFLKARQAEWEKVLKEIEMNRKYA